MGDLKMMTSSLDPPCTTHNSIQFNSIQLLWNYAQDEIPSRDFAVTLSDGQHSNDMTLSSTVHSDSHHIRQNNTHEKFIGNLIKQN